MEIPRQVFYNVEPASARQVRCGGAPPRANLNMAPSAARGRRCVARKNENLRTCERAAETVARRNESENLRSELLSEAWSRAPVVVSIRISSVQRTQAAAANVSKPCIRADTVHTPHTSSKAVPNDFRNDFPAPLPDDNHPQREATCARRTHQRKTASWKMQGTRPGSTREGRLKSPAAECNRDASSKAVPNDVRNHISGAPSGPMQQGHEVQSRPKRNPK